MLKIEITLNSTLELEALESALDMFQAYAEDVAAGHPTNAENPQREIAVCKAGVALLARIRGGK